MTLVKYGANINRILPRTPGETGGCTCMDLAWEGRHVDAMNVVRQCGGFLRSEMPSMPLETGAPAAAATAPGACAMLLAFTAIIIIGYGRLASQRMALSTFHFSFPSLPRRSGAGGGAGAARLCNRGCGCAHVRPFRRRARGRCFLQRCARRVWVQQLRSRGRGAGAQLRVPHRNAAGECSFPRAPAAGSRRPRSGRIGYNAVCRGFGGPGDVPGGSCSVQ